MKHLYLFDEINSCGSIYGVATYINALINCLRNTKIKITVFKLMSEKQEVFVTEFDFVRYIYIPALVHVDSIRKYYYRNVFYLIDQFINRDESIIFHFNYLSCTKLVRELKRHVKATFLLTIHYRSPVTSVNIESEKELINSCCDKIIVLATHAKNSLYNELNVDLNNVVLIPNGLDDRFYSLSLLDKSLIRSYFKVGKKERVILYAGRLDENKNASIVIKSFIKLLQINEHVHLFVVGSGNYDNLFSDINHSWGKITFTGHLSQEDLYRLYLITDVGVIPSVYEEFGYVAIEMMMHQIPVVANNTSGLAEIFEDGVSGLLFNGTLNKSINENNVIDLVVSKIDALLSNDEYRNIIAKNARNYFLMRYEITLFRNNMLELYNSLL